MISTSRILRRATSLLFATSAATFAACATNQTSTAPAKASAFGLVGRELQDTSYASVYDLLAARRPAWLVSRASERGAKVNEVRVLFDNQFLGGVNDLRSISPMLTYSVTYVDPAARNRGPTDGQRSNSGLIIVRSLNLVKRSGK